MFFKKPDAVKLMQFTELKRYIDSLFDSQVSRVIDTVNKSLNALAAEVARFYELSEKFYSTDSESDMEFIEHMSSGFIKSQKALYSKSLSSILSGAQANMQVVADTHYEEVKLRKESFESIIQDILKLNSKFSMILVAYPKQMEAFKRQFSRMDKLLKSINEQLKGVSNEVGAYNSIMEKIAHMEEYIVSINEARAGNQASAINREEGYEEKLRNSISYIKSERSSYESKRHSAEEEANAIKHNIVSLLQPLSRAARIYDHESKGKIKIAEFISNPFNLLQGSDKCRTFEAELLKMQGYISSNPSKFKGYEAELTQISTVIKGNVPDMLARIQSFDKEIDATKEKIAALTAKIHETENEKSKLEEKFGEMVGKEEALRKASESMLKLKEEIEALCLNTYRVKLEITGMPEA